MAVTLALLWATGCVYAPGLGQPDGVAAELARIEAAEGLQLNGKRPLIERIAALEQKLFGKTCAGPVPARIAAISKMCAARQTVLRGSSDQGLSSIVSTSTSSSIMDALPVLNAFPPVLLRKDDPAFADSPDYYSQVAKACRGRVIRFKQMPIPVYVQPFPDRDFVNCVVQSFEAWEERTSGAVRFVQVDNQEAARIRVVWKHLGTKTDNNGCLLGAHTILKYTNRGNGSLSLVSVGAVPVPVYIPRVGPKYLVPPQLVEVNLDLIMSKDHSIRYRACRASSLTNLDTLLGFSAIARAVRTLCIRLRMNIQECLIET